MANNEQELAGAISRAVAGAVSFVLSQLSATDQVRINKLLYRSR